jgi:5-formyltetrahydrofolate cyclo-ligase
VSRTTGLDQVKQAARKAAFARRKAAYETRGPGAGAELSSVLAGYRGVPLAGYMPIRTEIDPRHAMAEATAYGPVGVPVIKAADHPLEFALWEPDSKMIAGDFGALIPENLQWMVPEILIVPLLAFDRQGGRLGYGGGFYDRTLEGLRTQGPVLAIGFAFAAQEAEALPLEITDQPLDMIITEKDVIELG